MANLIARDLGSKLGHSRQRHDNTAHQFSSDQHIQMKYVGVFNHITTNCATNEVIRWRDSLLTGDNA